MNTVFTLILLFANLILVVKGKYNTTTLEGETYENLTGRYGNPLLRSQRAAVDPCNPNPCRYGGTCKIEGNKAKCDCLPGYKGNNCFIVSCAPNPCKNGATCKVVNKNVICDCIEQFSGPYCEKYKASPCSSNPCKNGGKCEDNIQYYNCSCTDQYTGNNCEYRNVCNQYPGICKNGGTCIPKQTGGFNCNCLPNISDSKCRKGCEDLGGTHDCNKIGEHWSCINDKDDNSKYTCDCFSGYIRNGTKCTDPCLTNPCKNGGICTVSDEGYKCYCKPPYYGSNCETDPCSTNPCKNEGICTVTDEGYKCYCKSPYSGSNCETDPCSSKPCNNGGTCRVVGSIIKCFCKSPFSGERCEKSPCSTYPCKNQGICTVSEKGYKCNCKPPYSGDNCETECDCENGHCVRDSSGDIVCQCLPGYGLLSKKECKVCDCGKHANCTFQRGWFGTDKYCLCLNGKKLKNERCNEEESSSPPTFTSVKVITRNVTPSTTLLSTTQKLSNITTDETTDSTNLTDEPVSSTFPSITSDETTDSTNLTDRSSTYVPVSSTVSNTPYDETTDSTSFTDRTSVTNEPTIITDDYPIFSSSSPYETSPALSASTATSALTSVLTESTHISRGTTEEVLSSTTPKSRVCDCGKHSISCWLDHEGNKICLCENGFSELDGACIDCYCGIQSRGCRFDGNKEKKCLCKEGYAQKDSACKETCKYDRECLNGGICKLMFEGFGFCECRTDFSGDRCENNNVCSHLDNICQRYGAVCKIKEGWPYCECPPNQKDISGLCEDICNPHKCVHGRCEIFGQEFKCRCDVGYTGSNCDSKTVPDDH